MHERVLVVEDEPEIAELVALHLRDAGCEVEIAGDGETALLRAAAPPAFDLLVLDLRLPGIDGLEVCRRLRAAGPYTPILMLTARSDEMDRVVGLEIGADDYLTKPFSVRELVARAKAILRRVEALRHQEDPAALRPLRAADLAIDPARRAVTRDGEEIHLTAREFDLLLHFASRPGRVYTRQELLDQVWGHGYQGYEHTVNSHINRLRAKIERDPAEPQLVLTVWGVGYKFRDRGDAD